MDGHSQGDQDCGSVETSLFHATAATPATGAPTLAGAASLGRPGLPVLLLGNVIMWNQEIDGEHGSHAYEERRVAPEETDVLYAFGKQLGERDQDHDPGSKSEAEGHRARSGIPGKEAQRAADDGG